MANGAIDWYLRKKRSKKTLAKIIHRATYALAMLAAIIPLLKIFNSQLETEIIRKVFGNWVENPGAFAAEAALVLIGIAGGINLIDRYAGLTTGWMRYMMTAERITEALIEFQFQWSELDRTLPVPDRGEAQPRRRSEASRSPAPTVATSGTPRGKKPVDPIKVRVALVQKFCDWTIETVAEEMEIWSNELKERVSQLGRLQHPGRPQ